MGQIITFCLQSSINQNSNLPLEIEQDNQEGEELAIKDTVYKFSYLASLAHRHLLL